MTFNARKSNYQTFVFLGFSEVFISISRSYEVRLKHVSYSLNS